MAHTVSQFQIGDFKEMLSLSILLPLSPLPLLLSVSSSSPFSSPYCGGLVTQGLRSVGAKPGDNLNDRQCDILKIMPFSSFPNLPAKLEQNLSTKVLKEFFSKRLLSPSSK